MLLSLSLLIVFSEDSIKAEALTGGAFLSVEASRQYFGDEISGYYHTANGQQSCTFRYYGTDNFPILFGYDSSLSNYDPDIYDYITSANFLIYSCDLTGIVNDPTQIVLDISPTYSSFDTTKIVSCVGASGTYYSPEAYISASWDWYFQGQSLHFESPTNTFGYGMRCTSYYLETEFNLVPASMSSNATTSGYSVRAVFPVADSTCYVCIGCPFVSAGSSGGTGGSFTTVSSTSSSSSGSGSPEMEETNGLLGSILNWLSGFGQMILGLFIPDSDFLETWCEAMKALLEDHLGGAYDAIEMMIDLIESLYHPSTVGSISCPTMNLPGGLVLGGWTLDLKYNNAGMNTLYTALAWIIDFLATCFFLNSCRKKVEIILNPNSEVVSNDN